MPAPYKSRRLRFLMERRRKGAPEGVAVVPNGEGGDHIPPRPFLSPGASVRWHPDPILPAMTEDPLPGLGADCEVGRYDIDAPPFRPYVALVPEGQGTGYVLAASLLTPDISAPVFAGVAADGSIYGYPPAPRRADASLEGLIGIVKAEPGNVDPGSRDAAISEVCDRAEAMLAALKGFAGWSDHPGDPTEKFYCAMADVEGPSPRPKGSPMLGPDGQAFRCRECERGSMAVIDTRATEGGEVRRRRACACGFRITTFEIEMQDVQGGRIAHLRLMEAKAARYDALVAIMAEPLSGGA